MNTAVRQRTTGGGGGGGGQYTNLTQANQMQQTPYPWTATVMPSPQEDAGATLDKMHLPSGYGPWLPFPGTTRAQSCAMFWGIYLPVLGIALATMGLAWSLLIADGQLKTTMEQTKEMVAKLNNSGTVDVVVGFAQAWQLQNQTQQFMATFMNVHASIGKANEAVASVSLTQIQVLINQTTNNLVAIGLLLAKIKDGKLQVIIGDGS